MTIDYRPLMEPVARFLLGEPTETRPDEIRYGRHGSLKIKPSEGVWHDKEDDIGGGVCDFIKRETGQEPVPWLKENGFIHLPDEAQVSNRQTEYNYIDEDGVLLFQVIRKTNKEFSQRRPDPKNSSKWINNVKDVRQVPYRLPEIMNRPNDVVFIVEGEKDADRLHSIGLLGSCNSGGANKWRDELTPHFEGRDVVIIPDNDDAGRKHLALVSEKLSGVAKSVKVLDLAKHWKHMPNKGDVSDYLNKFGQEGFKSVVVAAETLPGHFEPLTISPDFHHLVASMPPRPWIIENHLLRGYVSATFAPGGVGKSTFQQCVAVSVASGRNLLHIGELCERVNVLIINNEDDEDEIQRRLAGILQFYGIQPDELTNRLYWLSGYGSPLLIAQKLADGTVIQAPQVEKLVQFIEAHQIGAVFIDPYISTHTVDENDNTAIDKVITQYKQLAKKNRCAISLVHHTKKNGTNDSEAHAGDAEAGRGASSLKDAARCAVTLAKMSSKTAETLGKTDRERVRYFRLDTGKLNFGLPDGAAAWFFMNSVGLPNGDFVGVPNPVNLKPDFEKSAEKDGRVKWTPTRVAEALHRIIRADGETPLPNIRIRFQQENDIASSQTNNIVNMLSDDTKNPTRIKVDGVLFEYWKSKAYHSAPVIIHRREL